MDKIPDFFKAGTVYKNVYIVMPQYLIVYQQSDDQFWTCSWV